MHENQTLKMLSIQAICAALAPNSTYIPNTVQSNACAIKAEFVRRGWRVAFIEDVLAKLDDHLLEGWDVKEFMEAYVKEAIQRPQEHQQSQQYPSISQSLLEFGVREEVAREVDEMMRPLENTCYTDSQMVDVALEYLVGRYDPLCP